MVEMIQKRVRLKGGLEGIRDGAEGLCTTDFPDDNVFAVWFDEIVLNNQKWVRFDHSAKDHFELAEVSNAEMDV